MKRQRLKSSSLALLAAVLSIWSIACDTSLIPAATPVSTPIPAAASLLAPILTVTPVSTPIPMATLVLAPILTVTPVSTPIPMATLVLAPIPTAMPIQTPIPTAMPVPAHISTATNFNPDLVGLAAIGSSATITMETVGVDSGAQAAQINVQHSAELQVSSPACAGIFTGGTELGPALVTGGTVIGCVLLAGDVSGPTGAVMTFELTRIGNFNTDQVVTFGVGGPLGTIYSGSGITIDPGIPNQLIVRPSSR